MASLDNLIVQALEKRRQEELATDPFYTTGAAISQIPIDKGSSTKKVLAENAISGLLSGFGIQMGRNRVDNKFSDIASQFVKAKPQEQVDLFKNAGMGDLANIIALSNQEEARKQQEIDRRARAGLLSNLLQQGYSLDQNGGVRRNALGVLKDQKKQQDRMQALTDKENFYKFQQGNKKENPDDLPLTDIQRQQLEKASGTKLPDTPITYGQAQDYLKLSDSQTKRDRKAKETERLNQEKMLPTYEKFDPNGPTNDKITTRKLKADMADFVELQGMMDAFKNSVQRSGLNPFGDEGRLQAFLGSAQFQKMRKWGGFGARLEHKEQSLIQDLIPASLASDPVRAVADILRGWDPVDFINTITSLNQKFLDNKLAIAYNLKRKSGSVDYYRKILPSNYADPLITAYTNSLSKASKQAVSNKEANIGTVRGGSTQKDLSSMTLEQLQEEANKEKNRYQQLIGGQNGSE